MSIENNNDVLVKVEHLNKFFKVRKGLLHAVDDVTFNINKGETLGVVGESGCGKSTLGRTILGLLEATSGNVWFGKKDVSKAKGRAWKMLRKDMQIIFQDPMASLNPRFTVADSIAEPLKIFHVCRGRKELNARVKELMDTVGLAERLAGCYPNELDGGRLQRIGVARALALNPKLIVCDEPVSALDVSIQAQILNLLQDIQREQGLTYLFITHDMSVVKHISDDIMVMYLGKMMELAPSKELFRQQLHPYSKGLIAAIPIPDLDAPKKKLMLQGELTSPINPKPGCRFANRCAYAKDKCREVEPTFDEVLPGHYVACHYCREINGIS